MILEGGWRMGRNCFKTPSKLLLLSVLAAPHPVLFNGLFNGEFNGRIIVNADLAAYMY